MCATLAVRTTLCTLLSRLILESLHFFGLQCFALLDCASLEKYRKQFFDATSSHQQQCQCQVGSSLTFIKCAQKDNFQLITHSKTCLHKTFRAVKSAKEKIRFVNNPNFKKKRKKHWHRIFRRKKHWHRFSERKKTLALCYHFSHCPSPSADSI